VTEKETELPANAKYLLEFSGLLFAVVIALVLDKFPASEFLKQAARDTNFLENIGPLVLLSVWLVIYLVLCWYYAYLELPKFVATLARWPIKLRHLLGAVTVAFLFTQAASSARPPTEIISDSSLLNQISYTLRWVGLMIVGEFLTYCFARTQFHCDDLHRSASGHGVLALDTPSAAIQKLSCEWNPETKE